MLLTFLFIKKLLPKIYEVSFKQSHITFWYYLEKSEQWSIFL